MKTEEMKIISDHLIDALNKEDLTTRAAARALNLNPSYISMAKNPRHWDTISKDAWYRLTHWHNSRGRISEFKIPEDEEILPQFLQSKQQDPKGSDYKALIKKNNEWNALAEAFRPPDLPEAHLKVCLDLEVNLTVRVNPPNE